MTSFKSQHNFRVIRLDGTEFNMHDLNILVSSFVIDSIEYDHYKEEIEGIPGFIDMGSNPKGRTMRADCKMLAVDSLDLPLMRNEIFKIFDSREPFYIVVDEEPGKRWLVKCNSKYSIKQKAHIGKFSIDFISSSPYAESVGTTLDSMTFDSELWQVGQGLTTDEDMIYIHTATEFRIFNAGDVAIDPRDIKTPLKITFTGASTNLSIKNTTTNEEWIFTGSTSEMDTVVLDGVRSLKNGVSIFGATNHKLITLDSGWNDFVITGSSSFQILFDFRFYYK